MTECRCSRIINDDAYVCKECVKEASKDLAEVAYFLRHIDEKRARITTNWRFGTVGRSPEVPLPYDPRVGKALGPIRNALTTWARIHQDEHPEHPMPPTDLTRTAAWLADFTEWDAGRPWAHDAFDQYQSAHEGLKKLFDIPPEREAIGTCGKELDDGTPCPEILAAEKGATTHTCPRCGHSHDVKDRREAMLDEADDFTVTIAEAVRMLRTTDRHHVSARLIRALVRYVPILDKGQQAERDITDRVQYASVYPLGAIRDALSIYDSDKERQREINRVMNGRPAKPEPRVRHAS